MLTGFIFQVAAMQYRTNSPLHLHALDDSAALNRALVAGMARHADDPATRKTHFFHGRYENLYIDRARIPELGTVLDVAAVVARRLLGLPDTAPLRCGGWFNRMGPGQVTLPHRHDDDDELLSAVYYVQVPPESGELLLHEPPVHTRVEPREGLFVFFPPTVLHEVTENRSMEERLSIGINIGPHRDD
ncbi:MAG TPA: 2OG-Fe(II) oxygenase [Gammaproteobacteria bacterium]